MSESSGSSHHDYEQYLRENEVAIRAITDRTRELLDQSLGKAVVEFTLKDVEAEEIESTGRILAGSLSAANVLRLRPDATPEDAQEIADTLNGNLTRDAYNLVLNLAVSVEAQLIGIEGTRLRTLGKTDEEIDVALENFAAKEPKTAVFSFDMYEDAVEPVKVVLKRAELLDDVGRSYAQQNEVTVDDGLIEDRIGFIEYEGKIIAAYSQFNPTDDQLFQRAVNTLNNEVAFDVAFHLMAGRVEDIAASLDEIRQMYQDTPKENEITSLLNELGARARAVKESRELALEFLVQDPPPQKLEEFTALLQRL